MYRQIHFSSILFLFFASAPITAEQEDEDIDSIINRSNLLLDLDSLTTNSYFIPFSGIGSIFLITNCIIAGICLLINKNPIYALLSLIAVFFNAILLLLTLKIEFLALTFLIIYVGAIAILFLFVIMMFNLKKLQLGQTHNN